MGLSFCIAGVNSHWRAAASDLWKTLGPVILPISSTLPSLPISASTNTLPVMLSSGR